MAAPPNATVDALNPPSSDAASKTPTSSRMCILSSSTSYFLVFSSLILWIAWTLISIVSRRIIIDLLAIDRLPTVSASDAFRNLSDDHQSPSNAYTDISELDDALGGGFECGRVTELWGPPGAGKTAIAYVDALKFQQVFDLISSQSESRHFCPPEECGCCLDWYVLESSGSCIHPADLPP